MAQDFDNIYNIHILEEELLNLYDRETDKQTVSLFLNWFRQLALYGKIAQSDYAKLDYVYRTKEEVHTMLVATLEQERKKIYQTGVVEGKAEGQEQALLLVVELRFQPTAEERLQLTEQMGKITDPQIRTFLLKRCLQAATLAEFMAALTDALPKSVALKQA